jgi:hypothetical protein
MDDTSSKSVSVPVTDSSDLREQIESLRHLVGSVLILLVVLSGTFTVFLLRELKNVSAQVDAIKPGATNMMAVYQKQQAPLMEEFAKRIQLYGRTHPDFAPVLTKWDPVFVNLGWKIQGSTTSGSPPAVTSPAPNTPPKK